MLLERHDLTLHYEQVFDRWIFDVKDREGNVVWHCQEMNLVFLRDELLEFLKSHTENDKFNVPQKSRKEQKFLI